MQPSDLPKCSNTFSVYFIGASWNCLLFIFQFSNFKIIVLTFLPSRLLICLFLYGSPYNARAIKNTEPCVMWKHAQRYLRGTFWPLDALKAHFEIHCSFYFRCLNFKIIISLFNSHALSIAYFHSCINANPTVSSVSCRSPSNSSNQSQLLLSFVTFLAFDMFSDLPTIFKRLDDAYNVVIIHRRRSAFEPACPLIETYLVKFLVEQG